MDEKEQNTNQYTGEYGNAVEAGEDSQGSVYSFSYRDNRSPAVSSGDYHAEDHVPQPSGQEEEQERRDTPDSAENGWQAPPFQQAQPDRQTGDGQQIQEDRKKPQQDAEKKNSGLSWKKVGACAGCAVVFGVVAAVCFQAVCYFSSRVLKIPGASLNTDIAYTTDNVSYTGASTDTAIGTADVSGIAQNTMPSIVAITSTEEGENYYDLFGQYYQGQDTTSCGSGFIVGKNDTELLIATNNHVIDGAKTISVQFIDEEVYEATKKGSDSSADLAVIAVKLADIKASSMKKIKAASLGDSSEAKVGEMVVAIGNALGYGQSVTVGYISARDREISEGAGNGSAQNSLKVIQTDAAINPGNSGGALLNMRGEVIGINSAKIADSSVEGVGYAIPISEATPIIDELMNKEVLTDDQKGYLGISGKTVSEEAVTYHVPEGVYVNEVAKDGAAGKAGIQQGDVITAINDVKVTTMESLKEKANSYKKGTKVTITFQRNDNGAYQEKRVEVILQGESSLNGLPESTPGSRSGNEGDSDSRDGNGFGNDGGNGSDGNDGSGGSGWGLPFPFGFGN